MKVYKEILLKDGKGGDAYLADIIMIAELEAKMDILEKFKDRIGIDAKKLIIKFRNRLNHIRGSFNR